MYQLTTSYSKGAQITAQGDLPDCRAFPKTKPKHCRGPRDYSRFGIPFTVAIIYFYFCGLQVTKRGGCQGALTLRLPSGENLPPGVGGCLPDLTARRAGPEDPRLTFSEPHPPRPPRSLSPHSGVGSPPPAPTVCPPPRTSCTSHLGVLLTRNPNR